MNPGFIFLLLFVGIPVTELYFMIEVGSAIGAISTISLVVFTAVLGGLMVRMQGFSTMMRVREMAGRGEVPAVEMMEGVVLLISGFSLLLPGFFTDALGFLALIPPLRRGVILWFLQRSSVIQPAYKTESKGPNKFDAIEGECHREDD
ncbi:MAG: FxsA family protein [Candidatus Polarisedimenticolaceae bacterium]|nr:FxsA family protein [Candidatus Polarisedimenticolaceae bacterium]